MRPRIFWLALAGFALSGTVQATAETVWIGDIAPYELTDAELFDLRDQMPADLQTALNPLRNVSFPDEAAFRAKFAALVPDAEDRSEWMDTLTAGAAQPGVSFGIEALKTDILTIRIAGSDRVLDADPFTSKSWLTALPPPADTPLASVTATMDGACLNVTTSSGEALFSLCDARRGADGTSVALKAEADAIYGLGQQFGREGDATANRIGEKRDGLNAMTAFNGGANGNTLIPIAYFDRTGTRFALFLDNRYPQVWDFSSDPWRLSVKGGSFRLHVLTAPSLAELRRRYMALSGPPPVPPKAMFGLWLSEFGFDNWREVDNRIARLDADGFPLSGIALDLQWFGGIDGRGGPGHMGSLSFDTRAFPKPAEKIAALKARGIGIMPIEESYIDKTLPEFADMARRGYLAHDASGAPLMTAPELQWWGWGGMIDWLNPEAGAYWHDLKRQPLINKGVTAHWTDLGEPELYNPANLYGPRLDQNAAHNSYNLMWLESIAAGYRRDAPSKRVFMLSRSGAAGMQRLGAAMWSGDTGSDYWTLLGQMPQQTHMMWSGIDYYGSDVGGFHRDALSHYDNAPSREAAMGELYTQWFAYSALFEIPVRPHTENLCNCKQTAPDRIGDVPSNLANIRLRYALLPYYYSLAHAAWHGGEPVFPSLDYWYPQMAGTNSQTRMIGRDLVGAGIAQYGADTAEILLPAGTWYDFRTGTPQISGGGIASVPVWKDGVFTLPLFARDGAVIPVSDDGHNVLQVFGAGDGQFDWFNDDGETLAYQDGFYDLIYLDKTGGTLVLNRALGKKLSPDRLVWHLPEGMMAKAVMVDGQEVHFTTSGSSIELELPPLGSSMTITLER